MSTDFSTNCAPNFIQIGIKKVIRERRSKACAGIKSLSL